MRYLDKFLIPHTGLNEGKHPFRYEVDKNFFEAFENEEIEGIFKIDLEFDKKPSMYVLNFSVNGNFNADCDRCVNPIEVPIEGEFQQIVKFSEDEFGEDVFCLPPKELKLDVSPFIYDYIMLRIPLTWRRDCENEDYKYCNQKVLDTLENFQKNTTDNPIWDTLKDLNIKS